MVFQHLICTVFIFLSCPSFKIFLTTETIPPHGNNSNHISDLDIITENWHENPKCHWPGSNKIFVASDLVQRSTIILSFPMVSDCQEFDGGGFSLKVSRVMGLEQWGAGLSRSSISLCVVLGPFHELYLG